MTVHKGVQLHALHPATNFFSNSLHGDVTSMTHRSKVRKTDDRAVCVHVRRGQDEVRKASENEERRVGVLPRVRVSESGR